jgi:hypothetical protein
MLVDAFMVGEVMDCWHEGGGRNVGAMSWRSHEMSRDYDVEPRPLPHLSVMTSAGLVCLDCPSSDPPHSYWRWTGVPPKITVTPSLNVSRGEWHGWLVAGQLVS